MQKRIKNISILNKLIIVSLLLLAVSNPWSVAYISYGLEVLSVQFIIHAKWAFIASIIMLVGICIYFMYVTRDVVKASNARDRK